MAVDDYLASLDRALSKMPDDVVSRTRFIIPEVRVLAEGKTTVLENFTTIVDAINREPDHFFKFLVRELGTAGKIDGNRLIFQGRFAPEQISSQINAYVEEYVICSECGRPDTELVKSERILMLKCDACGAIRPVKKRFIKPGIARPADEIAEGETYMVQITAVGAKGDGIAKKAGNTIFVKGAKKGDVVKVLINKISGNLVFAEVVHEK
ncbi:translation initiation factor IF-2 subunit beta [Methanosarcinales archaeon]|nr:MAG: translation initiation factor IF-2 subunit beta [Methanosarcinales archaeon]